MLLEMTRAHVPVLAGELIDLTDPAPGDNVVDCTFGAGGHAHLVADRIGSAGTLVCIDRDPAAEARFEELTAEVACTTRFLRMENADALDLLRAEGFAADLVYMDLGVSSMQIDTRERGFSYSYDAPLDMRMDTEQDLDARTIVNEWDERRLSQLFRNYGEDPNSRRIARELVARRAQAPFDTTGELVDAIEAALPAAVRRKFGASSPAKRVFQAIRIAVNDELGSLERALPAAWDLLAPGGRLAAISFHSLEDRRVKRFLVARAQGCICPPDLPVCACGRTPEAELLTRRSVAPTPGEVAEQPALGLCPSAGGPQDLRGRGLMAPLTAPARRAPLRAPAPRRGPPSRLAAAAARRRAARRDPARPDLDRHRLRAAGGHRVLQRRPAPDEPRPRKDRRARLGGQARERPPAG